MIIREKHNELIFIPQHNHGFLSGELAKHWKDEWLAGAARREELIYAAYEHDRGWIELDDQPIWNDRTGTVFSFMDYPLLPKLTYYGKGIEEVAQHSRYAALLCSMHFTALLEPEPHPAIRAFIGKERLRQAELQEELCRSAPHQAEELQFHLQILQFCDHLSLYVCLNEPGVDKENEHPWYRSGLIGSDRFHFAAGKPVMASWENEQTVAVHVFPFHEPFKTNLRYKSVSRDEIKAQGVAQAYANKAFEERSITFVSK
ncbi:DUF3891 family protein [Paenibacillus sp. GCM10027626]|uniref:DUF3891 family protein n=1 Tax=Paenibacillus sp. GCM10027626 TaxID=3273411 RepID=UPI0036251B77